MEGAGGLCPCLRSRVIEFLLHSVKLLEVSPIVKYSALSLFADRFCAAFSRLEDGKSRTCWLLHPIRESNLQLFALVSLWISSKIHDTRPICVKSLKALGDELIKDQHYTKGDILEAEMVLMQVYKYQVTIKLLVVIVGADCVYSIFLNYSCSFKTLKFGIGTSNTAFILLEELLSLLRVIARVGFHVKMEACMDIMDILYENEVTSVPYSSPQALSASILVVAYVTTVPLAKWEFPILPWVKFVTSCKDEEIMKSVEAILKHIFQFQSD
ncbi:cyclin-J18 isoform X2 [Andrographis paniculata]|uniref:cyclin-J18 isoform X2 n=1 Tax=Andrographis paniculata TaxID=175694 RepID=UPI0021E85816|nr:cyclin-J18 isoform X2 [Andrographis paniculata]